MAARLAAPIYLLVGPLAGLLAMALPLPAQAENNCALRYGEAFARVPALGLRGLSQAQADAEVRSLFGPRPDSCEAGGYQRFLDGLQGYARELLDATPKQREGMLRVAIAAAGQGPARVPFAEGKSAVSAFRAARSQLHAIADEMGTPPLAQQLLDAFERSGPPQSLPPPAASPGPPGTQTQAIRPPTVPLPPWGVISLYEIRDALGQKDLGRAQGKIETIIKWMETAP